MNYASGACETPPLQTHQLSFYICGLEWSWCALFIYVYIDFFGSWKINWITCLPLFWLLDSLTTHFIRTKSESKTWLWKWSTGPLRKDGITSTVESIIFLTATATLQSSLYVQCLFQQEAIVEADHCTNSLGMCLIRIRCSLFAHMPSCWFII